MVQGSGKTDCGVFTMASLAAMEDCSHSSQQLCTRHFQAEDADAHLCLCMPRMRQHLQPVLAIGLQQPPLARLHVESLQASP